MYQIGLLIGIVIFWKQNWSHADDLFYPNSYGNVSLYYGFEIWSVQQNVFRMSRLLILGVLCLLEIF